MKRSIEFILIGCLVFYSSQGIALGQNRYNQAAHMQQIANNQRASQVAYMMQQVANNQRAYQAAFKQQVVANNQQAYQAAFLQQVANNQGQAKYAGYEEQLAWNQAESISREEASQVGSKPKSDPMPSFWEMPPSNPPMVGAADPKSVADPKPNNNDAPKKSFGGVKSDGNECADTDKNKSQKSEAPSLIATNSILNPPNQSAGSKADSEVKDWLALIFYVAVFVCLVIAALVGAWFWVSHLIEKRVHADRRQQILNFWDERVQQLAGAEKFRRAEMQALHDAFVEKLNALSSFEEFSQARLIELMEKELSEIVAASKKKVSRITKNHMRSLQTH